MYFVLSKTAGALVTPSILIAVLATAGMFLFVCRRPLLGRRIMLASVLLFVICGVSPVGYWLLVPLEARFPTGSASLYIPAGIIVLGGSIDAELSAGRGSAVFPTAADRLVTAAELARKYPNCPVIFTGGSSALAAGDAREADFAVGVFERLGLSKSRVVVERRARNTIENAAFTKAITSPKSAKPWILITSAYHMPRSVGLFRAAGFTVVPYPTDWWTSGASKRIWIDGPVGALRRTDLAVREWIGLLIAWTLGRTNELFPSPSPQEGN